MEALGTSYWVVQGNTYAKPAAINHKPYDVLCGKVGRMLACGLVSRHFGGHEPAQYRPPAYS